MSRLTTRFFLALIFVFAIAAAVFSLTGIKAGKNEAWATLAGALAVITSMISAWGAQRVVELEEDKLSPYPYPQFDATSRYGLMLLKVTNFGGGAAHNIRFVWDRPLRDSKGEEIRFSPDLTSNQISVLVPGQHVSKLVDGNIQFFEIEGLHIYGGTLEYENSRGRKKALRFVLDAESLKSTLSYDDERTRTHYELQKLPAVLRQLCDEVQKAATRLERHEEVE